VDEVVVVDEGAIASAMRWAVATAHVLLEGSAALGIAALQTGAVEVSGMKVAIVTTGRNVSEETLRSVLTEDA
jgi:threonine dehydratase